MPSVLPLFSFGPLINLVGVLICAATAVICAFLSTSSGHAPPWMEVPALHLIGYLPPEASLFSAGCSAAAVLLLFAGAMYHMLVRACQARHQMPQKRDGLARFANVAAFSFHAVACIALSVQACCPVQKDIVHTYFGYAALTDKTRLHQAAAACWWISAALHEVCFIIAVFASPALSFLKKRGTFRARLVFVGIAILACIISHLAMIPQSKMATGLTAHQINTTTICGMWISAAALVLALVFESWEAARILERIGIHPLLFAKKPLRQTGDSEQGVGLVSPSQDEEEKEEEGHAD